MKTNYDSTDPVVYYEVHCQFAADDDARAIFPSLGISDTEDEAIRKMDQLADRFHKVYLIKVERTCMESLEKTSGTEIPADLMDILVNGGSEWNAAEIWRIDEDLSR